MKKQLLTALCTLLLVLGMKAQTNIANYTLAKSPGTYVPLAAGASTFLTSWDNNVSAAIPLGGTFTFGAATYTACYISSNGYISFGGAGSTTNYTPLSTLGSMTGAVAGYAQDGASSTVSGSAPAITYANVGGTTGEFVVQFQDHANYYNRSVERLNFQIRLNLATGAINIVYGSWTAPGSVSSSGITSQVGIRGNTVTQADNVNGLMVDNIPAGTTCSWADAVTGFANSSTMLFASANSAVVPANGLTYTWAPPVTPIAPVRTFGAATNITLTSGDLSWTAPSGATQYNVQYRVLGTCAWTSFTGNPVTTPSVSLTGLTPSTVYQVRVQSSNGTNNAIWSHIPNSAGTGNGYTTSGTFRTLDPACLTPTAQPSGLVFSATTNTTTTGTFSPISFGTTPSYLVIRTLGTAPNTPTNGVTYTTGASAALNGTVVAVTTNSTFAVTGLTGNTNYAYYIYAYAAVNCSGGPLYSTGSPLTGTVTTCPAKATALTSSTVSPTDFSISWTAPAGGTASLITYSVEVSSNSGFTAPVAGSPFTVTAPTTSLALTGLNPATTYYYRVTADNGCNIGATASSNTTTAALPTDLQAVQLIAPAVNAIGCYGNVPVVVQIKNAGSAVLDFSTNNATIITNITGPAAQGYTTTVSTGTLAANATQNVTVTAAYAMSAVGVYTFNATATLATPDGNASNNTIPAVTHTVAAPSPLPQLCTFTGYTGTPATLSTSFPGWNEGSGAVTPAFGADGSFYYTNSAAQVGLYGNAAKMNIYSANTGWLISPKVIPTASHWFRYKAALVNYNTTTATNFGTSDTVRAMISTNCGANWIPLRTFNTTTNQGLNGSTNVLKEYFESLAPYAGQEVMVAIYARRGVSSTSPDIDIVIDDMEINTCFAPSTITTANTTISSTDLSWTAPVGGSPVNYVYEVRTAGAAGSGAAGLVTTGTVTAPSTSVTVTGLTTSTAYSVYVRSGCGGTDVSTWTPVTTFTTPAACPATSTPTVTNITGYSAVATWTPGASETLWDVYYGPTPLTAPGATTAPTATVSGTPSYTVSALTPTTAYAVYVRANCGAGNVSAWSAVRNFTTTVSCPAPATVVVSVITPTTAIATWTAGGAETNWMVKYTAPTNTVLVSGTPSYTMTGLAPSTTYSVQVKGICGAADSSAWTPLNVFTTLCQPADINVTGNSRCGVGSTSLVATSTSTSATIQWYNAPTGGTAIATGSVFTTPTLTNTTTYYATSTDGLSYAHVGMLNNVGALSYYITTGWGITFNASANTVLSSVAVYPGSAGTVTLSVRSDAAGTTVFGNYVATFTASDIGQKTVLPLNIAVPAGTGYKVLVTGYSAGFTGFHRESTAGFPYTTPGCPISVTSSEWGGTTTGTYYFFYDFVAQTGCESARTPVTATVTPPPALAVTSSTTVCSNVISTVSVTSTLSNYDNYTWSPVTNLYTDAAATVPYTGGSATTVYYKSATAGSTTYSVSASNSVSSCANVVSTTLSTSIPVINASVSPTVVCSGAAVTLSATTNANTTGNKTVGTNSLADYTGGPYREGAVTDNKVQYLFTAAELTAAGIAPGNITGLAFNVTTLGSGTMGNFTIRMGSTANTTLGATYDTAPLTVVYGPVSHVAVTGANVHTFTTPFNWDGVSNVIVQVCHDLVSGSSSSVSRMSITNRTSYTNASGACTSTSGTTVSYRPVVTFTGQVLGQGAGSYAWQWNPGAINSNTAVVTPTTGATPTTVTYTVSGTDPMTTCTNTAVVSVTVNPVPATPVAVNSIQCGLAIPTASVSGGTSYNWYATPTSTTVIQSGASATYTTAINATTNFYVSSFNGNCESPRAMLTASVSTPDAITASSTATSVCPGQSFTLTAANTGTNNVYSYTWTATPVAGSGITTSVSGATTSVMPTVPGNYTYLATASDAVCTATAAVQVTLKAAPNVATTNTAICVGSTAVLTASSTGVGAGSATIGTNSLTDYTGGPYRQGSGTDNKAQWLFTAAELSAANIAAGNITAIAFNVPTGSADVMNNFAVRIGTTTATGITTTFDANATTVVYGPSAVSAATGLNTYNFTTPFNWDGVSNIVVQVCHDVVVGGGGSTSVTRQSISNRTAYSNTSGACAQTTGISVAYRPVVVLSAQTSTNVAGSLNWVWNPGAVSGNTISVSPANTGTNPVVAVYTVTATDPVTTCSNSATASVTVNPIPSVTVAASTGSICSGTTASLTATGATTYSWMPAGGTSSLAVVSPAASTVYTVTGTSLGCSNTQTVNLNVTPTPTVVASVSPSVICAGATVSLTASGATTYSWMPNSSTSATTTATPSVSTIYSVTGTTSGCANTKTLSVTVNNVPTLTITTTPTAGVLCTTGATATLTATGTSTAYVWSNGANTASTSVAPVATTVYSVTGTNSCGVKTMTTSITVATTPTIAAASSSTLVCANNSAVLSATATPGVSYSWNTGASTMSISVSPSVTTTYTVTGTNACGSATATVVQNVSPCTGVETLSYKGEISIFPNPATDYVSISVPSYLASSNTVVEVTDALGKVVMHEAINTEVTTLRISTLKDGVYFFKVTSNNQPVKVGKVVKH